MVDILEGEGEDGVIGMTDAEYEEHIKHFRSQGGTIGNLMADTLEKAQELKRHINH